MACRSKRAGVDGEVAKGGGGRGAVSLLLRVVGRAMQRPSAALTGFSGPIPFPQFEHAHATSISLCAAAAAEGMPTGYLAAGLTTKTT